jgi:hypothetical protein
MNAKEAAEEKKYFQNDICIPYERFLDASAVDRWGKQIRGKSKKISSKESVQCIT